MVSAAASSVAVAAVLAAGAAAVVIAREIIAFFHSRRFRAALRQALRAEFQRIVDRRQQHVLDHFWASEEGLPRPDLVSAIQAIDRDVSRLRRNFAYIGEKASRGWLALVAAENRRRNAQRASIVADGLPDDHLTLSPPPPTAVSSDLLSLLLRLDLELVSVGELVASSGSGAAAVAGGSRAAVAESLGGDYKAGGGESMVGESPIGSSKSVRVGDLRGAEVRRRAAVARQDCGD